MTFKQLAKQLTTAVQTVPNLVQILRDGFDQAETGSDVEVTQVVTTGTELASIKVGDDPAVKIYAPEATGGIDYSTDEQDTGLKWIDGSAIYQKTVKIENISVTANASTELTLTDYFQNISKLINYEATTGDTPLPYTYAGNLSAYSTDMIINIGSGKIIISRGSGSNTTIDALYITIRYTKASTT